MEHVGAADTRHMRLTTTYFLAGNVSGTVFRSRFGLGIRMKPVEIYCRNCGAL